MRVQKHDYLLCKEAKGEFLVRAMEDSSGGDVAVYMEKNCHMPNQRTTLNVSDKHIVLNLGATPNPGKVYGVDVVNLYRGRKEHEDFGTINYFYTPKKEVTKDLSAAMTKTAKILRKWKLEFLLDDIVWEVLRYHKEKYAGIYYPARNEKTPARIQIRPEIVPASEQPYVLLHELGHHLDIAFLHSKKLKAHWLKVYSTSIKAKTIKKEESVKLLNMLLDQEDLPSDFKSQLGEEDTLTYKWILRTISGSNNLTVKDLDTLFEADMKDEIRNVWPQRSITLKELAPVVSAYATKNVRELFAESFSLHLTGKKLPDGIVRLLEKSISYAKANRS